MSGENPLSIVMAEQPQLSLWMTHLWQRLSEHRRLRIMDRAFLDLFAFSKNGNAVEIRRKAIELKARISRKRTAHCLLIW
jgi:hypothetical protein